MSRDGTADSAAAASAALDDALVLAWLPLKQELELALMKGQSSVWYFIEQFFVSALAINVTVALSSSAFGGLAGGTPPEEAAIPDPPSRNGRSGSSGGSQSTAHAAASAFNEFQRNVVRSMLSRLSGESGVQLLNVSNVPIQLGSVAISNRLVNQVGLTSLLAAHYRWAALAESRKVLGGAGPAIAQLPASILWAGISVVDLAREIAVRKRSPAHLPAALGHVAFTLLAQVRWRGSDLLQDVHLMLMACATVPHMTLQPLLDAAPCG